MLEGVETQLSHRGGRVLPQPRKIHEARDLIATCASPLSRNRTFGQELARGKTAEQVSEMMHGQIAEGVTTTAAARELAARYGVEMPITEQLYGVLFENKSPIEGLVALRSEEHTSELQSPC